MWLVAVAGLVMIVLGAWWYTRGRAHREYVIGREMAQAASKENARQARPHDPSPLEGKAFPFYLSKQGVFDPTPVPLDDEIRALAARFRAGDADAKLRISESLSMDDFYTVLSFADRSAIFAMRRKDLSIVTDGITAMAMVDDQRIDYRDGLISLAYLAYSATKLGADWRTLFRKTAEQGGAGAPVLSQFAARDSTFDDLRSGWMMDEVQTANGLSLIGWDGKPYRPTRDFKPLMLELSSAVSSSGYGARATIAADIPDVWFGGKAALERLRRLRAVGSVSGEPRQDPPSEFRPSHHLILWVAEAPDADAAKEIAAIARGLPGREHAVLAETDEAMVCVVIARSFVKDTPNIETDESLGRLSEPIRRALREHVRGK